MYRSGSSYREGPKGVSPLSDGRGFTRWPWAAASLPSTAGIPVFGGEHSIARLDALILGSPGIRPSGS